MNEYLDHRIITMFVSKIYHYRLDITNQFAIRNKSTYPELSRQIVYKAINDLRIWRRLLTKLDDNTQLQIQKELNKLQIK